MLPRSIFGRKDPQRKISILTVAVCRCHGKLKGASADTYLRRKGHRRYPSYRERITVHLSINKQTCENTYMKYRLVILAILSCGILLNIVFVISTNIYKTSTPYTTLEYEVDIHENETFSTRSYLVHAPIEQVKKLPVVLVFHGSGEHADIALSESRFNDIAEKHNFIVIYPDGTGKNSSYRSWNGGSCCSYAAKENTNDVLFIDNLIKDLTHTYKVDLEHIYATGFSNGAQFAYRIACESKFLFAGVGVVSGAGVEWTDCVLDKSIPTIGINEYMAIPQRLYSCQIKNRGQKIYESFLITELSTFLCKNETKHAFYYLNGASHGWSNVREKLTANNSTQFISRPAAAVIWDFFTLNETK